MNPVLFLFTLILVSACGTHYSKQKTPQLPRNLSEIRKQEFHTTAASLRHTQETATYDVESYSLNATFDWATKVLNSEVRIKLKLLNQQVPDLVLDSQVHQVTGVIFQGQPLSFHWENREKLTVDLTSLTTDQKNRPFEILIRYLALANSLEVGERVGLNAIEPRVGDPLPSRVLFTQSEPIAASTWMPCHDTPSDRARFSMQLTMPSKEKLVANGVLKKNFIDPQTGLRTMKYETPFTLPTYLMAFATGEFDTFTRQVGLTPVSLVTRKGLVADHKSILDMLDRQMTHFEKLVGPYPFGTYSLVLLPEFGGGMEHVGITFQEEVRTVSGLLGMDHWLTAHELGHQWFGDLITIREWDDLWIKEGMATLLAEEASRFSEDSRQSGRLFGKNFEAEAGEAIRDPQLPPDDKYTSGPYDRSAWFFTQLRSILGEERFWGTWRKLIKAHAFSSIGTQEVLKAFGKELGGSLGGRLEAALAAKALPKIHLKPLTSGTLEISVTDPDKALLIPLEVRAYQTPESYRSFFIDKPLLIPSSHFLVLDPRDIHALTAIEDNSEPLVELAKYFWPVDLQYFNLVGPHTLVNALNFNYPKVMTPSEFKQLYSIAGSEEVKFRLIQTACEQVRVNTTGEEEWNNTITPLLKTMPVFSLHSDPRHRGLSVCQTPAMHNYFVSRLRDLEAKGVLPIDELVVLAQWYGDSKASFATWTKIANSGVAASLRDTAISTLVTQLEQSSEIPLEEKYQWKSFLYGAMERTDVSRTLKTLLSWLQRSQDTSLDSEKAILNIIRRPSLVSSKQKALCVAHKMGKNDPVFIDRIKKGVPTNLPELLKGALELGKGCN